jgi:hypothetical protein
MRDGQTKKQGLKDMKMLLYRHNWQDNNSDSHNEIE